MTKIIPVLFLLLTSIGGLSAQKDKKVQYKQIQKIALTGDGGWDYITVDEETGNLYVSHGNMVQVVSTTTGKELATIPDTKGVHGIALAPEFGKGYISCGRDSSILVFDLKTNQTLSRFKSGGANPDAILYDAFSKKVFAFNGRSSNATVIDAATDKIVANIALAGKPEFAASDLKGKVFVNIENKGSLCAIDAQKMQVLNCWPVAPADEPSGLAIDREKNHLFTVSDGHMVVIDAGDGHVLGSLTIGDRVDGAAFDRSLKRAYSSNGDGTLTVAGEVNGRYQVLANIPTQKGARTIAVDSKTHRIYLPDAEFGETPKADGGNPHPRPAVKPGTFSILVYEPVD